MITAIYFDTFPHPNSRVLPFSAGLAQPGGHFLPVLCVSYPGELFAKIARAADSPLRLKRLICRRLPSLTLGASLPSCVNPE